MMKQTTSYIKTAPRTPPTATTTAIPTAVPTVAALLLNPLPTSAFIFFSTAAMTLFFPLASVIYVWVATNFEARSYASRCSYFIVALGIVIISLASVCVAKHSLTTAAPAEVNCA